MKKNNEIYVKYADERGEEYYCPIGPIQDDHSDSEGDLDDCIEVSTVGRYSGNLNVLDRSSK